MKNLNIKELKNELLGGDWYEAWCQEGHPIKTNEAGIISFIKKLKGISRNELEANEFVSEIARKEDIELFAQEIGAKEEQINKALLYYNERNY